MCDCQGKTYNIAMCCEPQIKLGPIENYYTKPTIDRMLDEITSAITSGCCITPEEVDEKIASAITDVEAEIPTVPTSNTAFTNDAGYLTEHQHIKTINGQSLVGDGDIEIGTGGTIDLSNYYTTAQTVNLVESAVTRVEGEIPTVPTSNTAFTNDAGYITGVDLSNYATTGDVNNVSTALTSHTSNTTIHVTPEQVSNWNAKSDFSGSYNDLTDKPTIPTVPTDISAFNNDVGYITGVDLSNYATKDNLTAATDDMATKTWVGQQGYLTEHQSLTAYSTTEQVNSAITQAVSGKQDTLINQVNIKSINNESLLGSGNITIQGGGGTDAPISAGTGTNSIKESSTDNTASGAYSHAEGQYTKATGTSAHAEGYFTNAYGRYSHAEGSATYANGDQSHAEGLHTETNNVAEHASGMYNVSHTGNTTAASTLFSVGNGDENTRRNAFEIRKNGDIYILKNGNNVKLQDITPGIWCGTMAEYQQISGSTDNNTIYLIHS